MRFIHLRADSCARLNNVMALYAQTYLYDIIRPVGIANQIWCYPLFETLHYCVYFVHLCTARYIYELTKVSDDCIVNK